jgi:hypothetical protein
MASCIWAIAREISIARSPRLGGRRRPVDGRQPRCGAILAGMKRRQETRGPRSRPVPDGRQSGGRQPTDSRMLNRRADGCLLCPWSREQSGGQQCPEAIAALANTITLDTGSHRNGLAISCGHRRRPSAYRLVSQRTRLCCHAPLTLPPPQHPQRAESVPAARRAEMFKLEIRLPLV